APQRFVAGRARGRNVIRRLSFAEIRRVVPHPLAIRSVPPHELLAIAPRRAVRARRRAVVEDASIGRPRKSPSLSVSTLSLALARAVAIGRGIHAGVDPAPA